MTISGRSIRDHDWCVWVISGHQESGGQDIFFPSKCSAEYFFPSSFLCRIIFPQKRVMCLHIQNVFIFTLWSLQ